MTNIQEQRKEIILEVLEFVLTSTASKFVLDPKAFTNSCLELYSNGFLFEFPYLQNRKYADPNRFDEADLESLWVDFAVGHILCLKGYTSHLARIEITDGVKNEIIKNYKFDNEDLNVFRNLLTIHMFQMIYFHCVDLVEGINGISNLKLKNNICMYMFLDECIQGGAVEPISHLEYEELIVSKKIPYAEYIMFLGHLESTGVLNRFKYKNTTLFSIFDEDDIEVEEVYEVEVEPPLDRKKSKQVFN